MTSADVKATSLVRPVSPSQGLLQPLSLDDVDIQNGFWGTRQELNRATMLVHAYTWMKKLGWIQNFTDATSRAEYRHRGKQFADSEIYKLIEALSWTVYKTPDTHLQEILNELIDAVVAAQDPDGYLHTLYGRAWQAPRYSDFMWGHELYCFGHYIQAAVANFRATGQHKLLESAIRLADHVCTMFGRKGLNMVCGHPEIEVALVELYRTTDDKKYLDQANLFIDRRGTGTLPRFEFGPDYWQDATPVREQDRFVGHSVRALYLAAGAVDAAAESHDDDLLESISRQWAHTVARRTYITGGMGSHHMDEAFGEDFVLPPDRSYCETCAGIAAIMVSWRLLLAKGDAKYADFIERALYNIVATAPSADGTAFFYANTLHQRRENGPAAINDEGVPIRGGASGRQEWFEVSCCPPNLARTLGSLEAYLATMTQNGIQIHQLAASTIAASLATGSAKIQISTDYPNEGSLEIEVLEAPQDGFELQIRVPSWAQNAELSVDGQNRPVDSGAYAAFQVKQGSSVTLKFPMPIRTTHPDFRIDAVRGTVAFEQGPEVLALESVDLPEGWDLEHVATTGRTRKEKDGTLLAELLPITTSEEQWPYGEDNQQTPGEQPQFVPLIRYHEWAERGPSTMRIFIPIASR